jgi:hypothetical protein
MKLYLMAGGLLLTAASVYGVADYVKTKNKKEFKELYKEVPAAQTNNVKLSDIKEEDYSRGKLEAPLPVENKTAVAEKPVQTKKLKKKTTSTYAPAKQKEEVKPVVAETKEETSKPEAEFSAAPTEKKTTRKKINMKMFSRAAPREEILIEKKKD